MLHLSPSNPPGMVRQNRFVSEGGGGTFLSFPRLPRPASTMDNIVYVCQSHESLYHPLLPLYSSDSEPCEDELDMLDMAFGLTDTSRLGCQVIVKPELEGMVVRIPPYEPQYT